MLFAAWALHDAEEALTFPATADYIADLTGIDAVRMSTKQSVAAIGVVGAGLAALGRPLTAGDWARGAPTMGAVAVAAHVPVRIDWSSLLRSRIPSRR